MKKRNKSDNIFWIILALLFIIGLFFDRNIADFFNTHQNLYIYSFMNFISLYAFLIPLFVIMYIIIIFKNKKNIIKYPVSVIITLAIVYLLKLVISRQRPFTDELTSFPSNHSASVFSVVPLFKKGYRIVWIIFSILVAFSRIYLGRHFLTDVIAGAVIGLVIGILTDKFIEKKLRL